MLVAATVFCVPAIFISPAIDDWTTSSPLFELTRDDLLPGVFWRPLERILRRLAGEWAGAVPGLYHLTAGLGHIGSALTIYAILKRVRGATRGAVVAAALFAVAPCNAAAVWSVDSTIQTMSTFFGLLSVWALVSIERRRRILVALPLMGVAVLWKESGIGWFVAAPLYLAYLAADSGPKRFRLTGRGWVLLFWGAMGALIYLAVRLLLGDVAAMGTDRGRYVLQANPLTWIQNGTLLVGVAVSTVDTVRLFGDGNAILGLLPGLFGVPLLWVTARGLGRSVRGRGGLLFALVVSALVAPHVVLSHVSEMYAHGILAGVVLLAGAKTEVSEQGRRMGRVSVCLAVAAALFVSQNKFVEMARTGARAGQVASRIVDHYGAPQNVPERVCTVAVPRGRGDYSVFRANHATASNRGRAVLSLTEWRRPARMVNADTEAACPEDVDAVWRIGSAGDFTVVPKETDVEHRD